MFFIITALSVSVSLLYGQSRPQWNGKRCAVVLTYDDALNVHLDRVVPLLDSLGMKGTFYLSGYYPGFRVRIADWKKAAALGHELGNHTLFHPCEGKAPGREWIPPDYDLNNYTMSRLLDEIRMTNTLLESVDGKKVRTYAYTCGDMKVADSSYVAYIKNDFAGARGVRGTPQNIQDVDLFNVGSIMINGESGDELISLVRQAQEQNGLLVFLFHGVGGEHPLNVSSEAHRSLLLYLKRNEKDIWIASMVDVVQHIAAMRTKNK